MPVRSLSSPVLKWPDQREVDQAVRRWCERAVATRPGVLRVGYFGSYARGDWEWTRGCQSNRKISVAREAQRVIRSSPPSVSRITAPSRSVR